MNAIIPRVEETGLWVLSTREVGAELYGSAITQLTTSTTVRPRG